MDVNVIVGRSQPDMGLKVKQECQLPHMTHCHHCKLVLGGQSAKVMLPACASSCSKWSALCVGYPISLPQLDDSEDEEGSEDEARRKWQEQEAAVSKTWVFKHVLLVRHAWYASPLAAGTPLGRDLGPWDDEDDVPLSLYLDHDKVHQPPHPTAVVIMPHVVPAVFSTQSPKQCI